MGKWQSEAEQRLRNLEGLRQAERSLEQEIEGLPGRGKRLQRQLRQVQCQVEMLEQALQTLTPEERLVAEYLLISPQRGNVQQLCAVLGLERASIYRRKDRVVRKISMALFGQ